MGYLDGDFNIQQSEVMPGPVTLASAATIVPRGFFTEVTGTVAIANITSPIDAVHMLCLVFTNANPSAFTGAGNVLSTKDPAQNEAVLLVYNPLNNKYYVVS